MDAMDDEEEEEVMELCSSLSEYIDISSVLALDPNRSGYVSCADLQTLMNQQSTELKSRGADPRSCHPLTSGQTIMNALLRQNMLQTLERLQ
jgi:hypothetical protein